MPHPLSVVKTSSTASDHQAPFSLPVPFLLLAVLLSSGCGLGEHVRTTSPYTFVVAALSIILGSIPVGMGLYGPWVALLLGAAAMTALVYGLGREPAGTGTKKID